MTRMFYNTTCNYFTGTTTKLKGKQNSWETVEPCYLILQFFIFWVRSSVGWTVAHSRARCRIWVNRWWLIFLIQLCQHNSLLTSHIPGFLFFWPLDFSGLSRVVKEYLQRNHIRLLIGFCFWSKTSFVCILVWSSMWVNSLVHSTHMYTPNPEEGQGYPNQVMLSIKYYQVLAHQTENAWWHI